MPKKGEYDKFKNFERKIKSPFMIYADFESILVPEDNGKQNLNESYTNKYQKYVACSYGYKLVCVDDKFSRAPVPIRPLDHAIITKCYLSSCYHVINLV